MAKHAYTISASVPYHRRARAYIATGSLPPLPIVLQRHFRLLVSVTAATIMVWGIVA